MKKKNVFLFAVAAVMAFAVSVSAETLGDLEYKIENGKITITDCTWNATNVTIPAEIDGCPVTSIGDSVFFYCYYLTSINIPESVTSIGDSAFSYCLGLGNINIPESVTSIGDYAFSGCYHLKSINIPESVTSIGDSAFSYCYDLTSINIPERVTNIGINPFTCCRSLAKITVNENNNYYISVDGVLFSKDKKTLISFPGAKTGEYSVPESVASIDTEAFYGCTGLTSINIPDSVTSIGDSAFSDCDGLKSINIPESVTSIGDSAFSDCDGLTSINIPEGVASIVGNAFDKCRSLWKITVNENNNYYISVDGVLFSKDKKTLISFPGAKTREYSVPESVTSIGDSAFSGCYNLTSINIPESVTSIGDSAFSGCTGLTSINIPESVTSISNEAFSWCTGLTSINIPESVTSISNAAFSRCTGLTSINIPESVTSIGIHAFFDCTGLTSIIIPDSVISIGDLAFSYLPQLKNVYYTGTREQFENINKAPDIGDLLNATIHYEWKPISVLLNGNAINFDVPPQLINGRTMVPMRAIFENLGATVNWEQSTQTVTSVKGTTTIRLTIGVPNIVINGSTKSLDTAPCVINGRTLVPVRAVSEAFNLNVDWNGATNTVIITQTKNGTYASQIENADSSYQIRLTYEDSVPKLNWKANEASLNLLKIIAKELDTSGAYASQIENADSSYQFRLTYEDSVPKLNWKADEASLNLLKIIAKELDS